MYGCAWVGACDGEKESEIILKSVCVWVSVWHLCVLEKGNSQAERDILSKCLWVRDRVLVCVI